MPFVPAPKEQQEKQRCMHPEHNPPTMIVWRQSGTWVCPACGKETPICVSEVKC